MGRTDVLTPLIENWPFDVVLVHNRFTLLNRSAKDVFARAVERGMTVFNAAPYAGGVFAKGSDKVKRITYQVVDDVALAPVRRIEGACAAYDVAPGAVALQFSMRQPRIGATIVGVSKPERVRQTLGWANESVVEDLWSELARLPHDIVDPEAERVYVPG